MEGLDQKGQIEVLRMYIQMKQNEAKNKIGTERNAIARGKVGGKNDPKLAQLWKVYKQMDDKVGQYKNGLNKDYNTDEIARANIARTNAERDYNEYAKSVGIPPMSAELSRAEIEEARAIWEEVYESTRPKLKSEESEE